MKNINFLIKPSSSKCNLKCKYCFYNDIANNRDVADYGFMKIETAKNIIEKAYKFSNGGYVTFAFQGGEPTLIGIEFYEKFVEMTISKFGSLKNIAFALQTNGIIINDEWGKFFKENNFLIGISIDGTKDIHNLNRIDFSNEGSYKETLRGVKILEKYKVDFNILTVVHKVVAKKINKIYREYKKNNFNHLQFIPCIDINEKSDPNNFLLTNEQHLLFLKSLFDLWYTDYMNGDKINIRYFDNILGIFLGYLPESCTTMGICAMQHVIEGDGSVYPCDFYVTDEYKIGDINIDDIEDMQKNNITSNFIKESYVLNNDCKRCEFLQLCRGGCKKFRNDKKNYYCNTYKEFFKCSHERFNKLATKIKMDTFIK